MGNHMEGSGPPPMASEKIASIPTVQLSEEKLEKNSSCSVCWEDFTRDEWVKELECGHCFHAACIDPWLEPHGTCPVCRKELHGEEGDKVGGSGDSGVASGAEPAEPQGGAVGHQQPP